MNSREPLIQILEMLSEKKKDAHELDAVWYIADAMERKLRVEQENEKLKEENEKLQNIEKENNKKIQLFEEQLKEKNEAISRVEEENKELKDKNCSLQEEKDKHRRELDELHKWYLKTLADRDKKFLTDLRAAEDKYKIEVERHAKLLEDALNNARIEREQASLRLDSEKDLNRENLE